MLICAIVALALTLSALTAVVVDTAYQAATQERRPKGIPPMAVAVTVLAVAIGAVVAL